MLAISVHSGSLRLCRGNQWEPGLCLPWLHACAIYFLAETVVFWSSGFALRPLLFRRHIRNPLLY